jgi:hypothetical protein
MTHGSKCMKQHSRSREKAKGRNLEKHKRHKKGCSPLVPFVLLAVPSNYVVFFISENRMALTVLPPTLYLMKRIPRLS